MNTRLYRTRSRSSVRKAALLGLAGVLLLGACNVLPESAPRDVYQLPPPSIEQSPNPRLPELRIGVPASSEVLGGNRLLIMTEDNRLQAFPEIRLAAPIPQLWRDWLLDAYWRDGRIDALSPASEGLRSSLELRGFLRAFQVDYTGSRALARIQFDATLISTNNRQIIARRRFEAQQPLESLEPASAIAALGLAANRLAQELLEWTMQEGSR